MVISCGEADKRMRAPCVHPLDPLTTEEISLAISAVRNTTEDSDRIRFYEVVLQEPDKSVIAMADALFCPPCQPEVLNSDGKDVDGTIRPIHLPLRQARLVTYDKKTNETSVWFVALNELAGTVVSKDVATNVQPPMDAMEYEDCEAAVKAYPPFVEAMKKRGVLDMSLVMVDPWCVGYHGEEDAPDRRLARPLIFCRSVRDEPLDNGYARPVDGIHVLVDLGKFEILEFEDRPEAPLPPPDPLRNYTHDATGRGAERRDLKPLVITQPDGPSFRVTGNAVEWQKWSFRVGFTPREGLVIHTVAYQDGSNGRRSVAYRLSFVEMVVPYGDPQDPHYRKNAFDAGEDGLGKNAHSLKLGCDCLGLVRYFDAHFTNFHGGVETIENCICMHEEDQGVLWKHMDWRSGLTEVRRSRRLSVSFFCTVANYEYGFFWHFYQDGKIEGEVKLTGILSLGAVKMLEKRKYGTIIAPGLYAPIHQHFFVARLDMAIDSKPGEASNQVVEVNTEVEEPGPDNPHQNAFYAKETLLKSESQAQRDCNAMLARHWIIRHSSVVNRTGQLVGYRLVPGSNCLPFAGPDAKFLRRAAFLNHNLWVTQFDKDERFPGGEFPNQNPRVGEGLPTWVKQDRQLEDADLVLWYVFGVTHIPRPEDWPVMPVEHVGFTLVPTGFFNCSPAIDVPPNSSNSPFKQERKSVFPAPIHSKVVTPSKL